MELNKKNSSNDSKFTARFSEADLSHNQENENAFLADSIISNLESKIKNIDLDVGFLIPQEILKKNSICEGKNLLDQIQEKKRQSLTDNHLDFNRSQRASVFKVTIYCFLYLFFNFCFFIKKKKIIIPFLLCKKNKCF